MKCLFEPMPWRQEVYLEVYSTFFPVLSWFHLALLELKSAKNAFIFLESYQLSWCFSLLPIIWTSFFLDVLSCYCSLIIVVACLPAVFVLLFSYAFCWFISLCVHLIYSFLSCFLFSFHVAFFPKPIFTQTVSNTQTCLLTSKLVIATMNGSNQNKYM